MLTSHSSASYTPVLPCRLVLLLLYILHLHLSFPFCAGKGERSTSQISLAADGIELTDEVIGTLHITIRRHLHVAKEKATDEYNEDGELNEARPLSGQDASSIPYDQVERGLKRMIAKAVTDPKTNESSNPLIEEMWATIDFQGMGLISVAAMDKFINKKFHVLKNSETLLYAYKLVSNSNRSVNLSGVTADRRSWVAYHDFMKLLCHQFYFKRFWAVYVTNSPHPLRFLLTREH